MIVKDAYYVISAVNKDNLPTDGKPEFMFCGRSNVGKSSFINMILGRKNLARTSSNPGKTQTLNIYSVNDDLYFIDVPGYGYAKVAKSVKESFGKMIQTYVTHREELKRVFLLVDFRHKPSEDDVLMHNFLKYYGLDITIIATKSDKIKNSERKKCKKIIQETLGLTDDDSFIITSSDNREGFTEVMKILDSEMAEALK